MNGRQGSSNGFSQGIIMDYDPMGTPNTALTNALNATFMTYNGNEGALQNDLGNGRVESAYLPEGFIPIGTTSFGGIMYIVSYNPLQDICQIGSFPSPERNFTKSESHSGSFSFTLDKLLKFSSEFEDKDLNQYSGFQLIVPLLNEDNQEIQLTSGDKFVLNIKDLEKYYGYLQGMLKNNNISLMDPCIRLVLGIRRDGQLRELSNLLTHNSKVKSDNSELAFDIYNYISFSNKDENGGIKETIDSYHDLIESPYNIVNCNISGTLCLIVKIVTLDTFDEQHEILI